MSEAAGLEDTSQNHCLKGQTGVVGDPERLEEGVTSSCACTLPGPVMGNDGDILQGTCLHLCNGVGVGGEWQPLFPVCWAELPVPRGSKVTSQTYPYVSSGYKCGK